jgi:hypothetical protein
MFISKKRVEALEARIAELEKALVSHQAGPKVLRSLKKQQALAEKAAQAGVKQYFAEVDLNT